ncbi:hypothetical protein G4B88_004332 [Cannabis sativa]|uniref:Pentatricopeptide repeat-containing protein n=1 Tax=Cannabis sativa TaxID=3483 RepID=A0A7J6EBD8_CANSA|nr:hypothetical protein G4B88_004332 [Cannabis sativa]
MNLSIRVSKAQSFPTNSFSLLLFHLFSSLPHYNHSSLSETHYRDLLFTTIDKKPWAFSSSTKWVSPKFRPIILNPELFVRVLRCSHQRPRIALRLFRWVLGQSEFQYSEFSFCAILEILAQNGMMSSAYSVMERAKVK